MHTLFAKLELFFFFESGISADDLFSLFDRYGKVVDIFIPRDRRYDYMCMTAQCFFAFYIIIYCLLLSFVASPGLVNLEVLHLYGTGMLKRPKRQLIA